MIARLRYRIPGPAQDTLNHVIAWLAILLVLSVAGFGTYYYFDRQPQESAGTPLQQETSRAEEAVRANPDDFGARMVLAGAYFAEGKYADSVEQYRAATKLDPENLDTVSGLSRSLFETGGYDESAAGFQKIIDAAQQADISPQLVSTAQYFLARIAMANRDYDTAIARARDALAFDRSDADALQLLGAAYVAEGNWDEAIPALTRATEFVPNFTEAYEQLAIAYQNKGMAGEARYTKGMQLYSSGKYDAAVKELEAAAAESPTLAGVHLGLGLTRQKQGKTSAAISEFEKTMALDANNFTASASLAQLGKPWPGPVAGAAAHGATTDSGVPASGGGATP